MDPVSKTEPVLEKKQRTLLIMSAFSPSSYSPAGERIFHTALASNSIFDDTVVLTLRSGNVHHGREKGKSNDAGSIELYAVNFSRAIVYPFSMLFDPVKFLVFFVSCFLLFRQRKFSYVLASMPPLETGLSAWLLSKLGRFKLIVDLRDDWESAVQVEVGRYFPSVILNIISKIAARIYGDAVVLFVASQTIADTARKRGFMGDALLVPNGADSSVFLPRDELSRRAMRAKYHLPLDKIIFVYSGSGTTPYYRLDLLFSGVRHLPEEVRKKIFMVFYVYNGAEQLIRRAEHMGIGDDVLQIRNPLPRDELAEVLASCDVGLLPFDNAPSLLCAKSTKLYEYLSSGLYVVSSGPYNGELDEFFSSDSSQGLFIQPRASDFAASFSFILSAKQRLLNDDLRVSRHLFIERNFDRRRVMEKAIAALSARLEQR